MPSSFYPIIKHHLTRYKHTRTLTHTMRHFLKFAPQANFLSFSTFHHYRARVKRIRPTVFWPRQASTPRRAGHRHLVRDGIVPRKRTRLRTDLTPRKGTRLRVSLSTQSYIPVPSFHTFHTYHMHTQPHTISHFTHIPQMHVIIMRTPHEHPSLACELNAQSRHHTS